MQDATANDTTVYNCWESSTNSPIFFFNKIDLLLSSVFAHGCYIKIANVIAMSCLFRVCWIAYLKVIFIINIQYDIVKIFPELQILCVLHCCIIFVMSDFRTLAVTGSA